MHGQIQDIFRSIGSCLMGIVNGIGSAIIAIVDGIMSVFNIIISFVTCGSVRRRKRFIRTG